MKCLYSHFDKSKIAELPRAVFPGRIVVINGEAEAERAVDMLLKEPILGFDTETRPKFSKGGMNPVALLQVSSHDVCFLFRLCQMGVSDSIVKLLEDREVIKVGLSWHDDLQQLRRRRQFKTGTFFELQKYVQCLGIEDLSLQKLYANVFGEKISKNQQLSNWEAGNLTEPQKLYAATDAWACIRLYEELHKLTNEGFQIISEERQGGES